MIIAKHDLTNAAKEIGIWSDLCVLAGLEVGEADEPEYLQITSVRKED